jgi:predicted DNA binding CopG/RHH family protein
MEIIKKEAEKRKIGYSTYIRMVLAESLLKGENHDESV